MRRLWLIAWVAACGRVDFEARVDATSDAPPLANYAFVTSTKQLPTTFGADFSGADAICNARAAEASLPGTYVAWLSSTTVNARDRLVGARGWIRTDGLPFADRIEDVIASTIFYPINRNEHGTEVLPDFVLTGTNQSGGMLPNCADYSDSAQVIYFGALDATAHGWTHESSVPCTMPGRIYCFGISVVQPVSVTPATGRTAFLSTQSFIPDSGGLATADGLCNSEASQAGLPGTYRALLATTGATAISRFSLSGDTWVRTDGVPIADSAAALSTGTLVAPLNVSATAAYRIANAWTGATSLMSTATSAASSCGDWTSTSGNGLTGLPSYMDGGFFSNPSGPHSCATGLPVYCLEQ